MGRAPAQTFALVFGAIYIVLGLIGFFVTGFRPLLGDTGSSLLGIELNVFHNIVHVGVGAIAVGAALYLSPVETQGVNFAIGGFYVLAAVIGYLGALDLLLSAEQGFAGDHVLHLVSGLLFVIFSIVGKGRAAAQYA
ncbi:MAG: DUF4383 domain-containing protein [Pseudonocardiaceae bacterium]